MVVFDCIYSIQVLRCNLLMQERIVRYLPVRKDLSDRRSVFMDLLSWR